MSFQLSNKLYQGISPQQYVDGMTKNVDKFKAVLDGFTWDDTELEQFFDSLNNRDDLRCMIIAADWCGDCVRNVPVVFKATEKAGIPTEVFIMEQHLDFIDEYLTLGGRSIPVVLFTDTGGHLLGKWGPRPAHVQEVMIAFKGANPDREAADYQENLTVARTEMTRRYEEESSYQTIVLNELEQILSRV
ncbi:MAG: thioredoxin family protein [Candidatus Cohnella colombiensis]|uniref:Thioredoxin family protein n=1 Tax=Candidatus Cohnella colombiensis TaxID=3121368 RepID=A0AA95F5E8_9BACL|nr:MAG: thioredoxin family protein [Cohnella sp.]